MALALFACLVFFEKIHAQPAFRLQLIPLDQDSAFLEKNLDFQTSLPDTALIFSELKSILRQLQERGHLEASFDSVAVRGDSTVAAWLHAGAPWRWASLRNGSVDEAFLDAAGYRQRLYRGKPFSIAQVLKLQERLLQQAENNGYPFAAVRLDSFQINKSTNQQINLTAGLFLEKGSLIFFDSLSAEGDAKISPRYLRSYLGWRSGEPFSRRKVLKIKDRLRELPFLKEKSNAQVTFLGDRASVRLFLEKKKASRFDFLLGILPASNRQDGKKILLTGTFNAELQNAFGLGERVFAAFERLRPQTQKLELALAYPYVLDLPFGADLKFSQYKRDSTHADVAGDFGVQYLFEGGNHLKAFWNSAASNLLVVDTAAIRQGRLPENLDVKSSGFGLEASWQRLDYRFNPRRGWLLLLRASAGTRQIRRNQAILNVAENFYDTLPGKTFRVLAEGNVERYFPLAQRSAVKLAGRGGAVFSEKPIYQNEQHRIGGNRLLRGFDEESVFATLFGVATLEYRLLVGENSYFQLFGDWGYVEDRRAGVPDRYQRLLGFGGGLTFETSAGVFGISLAVGKQSGAPADFRNPKIHFGYVSVF